MASGVSGRADLIVLNRAIAVTNQLFLNLVQHYVADQSITTVRKYVADELLTQRLSFKFY